MRLYVGKKVYCIDKDSPHFGKRLVVDKLVNGVTPVFSEALSGKTVDVREEQVGDYPPDEKDNW